MDARTPPLVVDRREEYERRWREFWEAEAAQLERDRRLARGLLAEAP